MHHPTKQRPFLLSLLAATVALTMTTSPNAVAHVGFSRDNIYTLGDQARQYKEGSTVFLT